jgi:hypothetical protein
LIIIVGCMFRIHGGGGGGGGGGGVEVNLAKLAHKPPDISGFKRTQHFLPKRTCT